MKPFSHLGGDLMYLKLRYDQEIDNYRLNAYRIVDGFRGPTDAVQVRRDIYIIENRGFVWKVSFDNKDQS